MNRFVRALAALLCLVLAGTALTACGGGESVDEILAQTFSGKGKRIESGKLNVVFRLDPSGDQPRSLRLSGPFDNEDPNKLPRFDFTLARSAPGQSFTAGAISTGEKGFLRLQGRSYAVGDLIFSQVRQGYERAQASRPEDTTAGLTFAVLGLDPRRWLTGAKKVGTEQVGGTETIHIRSGLDVPALLEDVDTLAGRLDSLGLGAGGGEGFGQLSPRERARLAKAVKDAQVDIWTGKDDKVLRKLSLDVALSAAQNGGAKAGRRPGPGKVALDLVLADVGEEQTIRAPARARPLSELGGVLGGLGGLGSGAGSGSGSASSSAPGSPEDGRARSAYLRCLREAGQDTAEIQGCLKLLKG